MGVLFYAANDFLDGGGNLGSNRFWLGTGSGKMEAFFFDEMGFRVARNGDSSYVCDFDTVHGQFHI